jgi:hypothetical protein
VFSIEGDEELTKLLITKLELMKESKQILEFCLERTSLDEVFVTIGNLFQVANGEDDFG